MAVLQFPGPDGIRPGMLAERAGMSKQAMNQLLRSLESFGYVVRSDAPDHGPRANHGILRDIEGEWSAELAPTHFAQLKELLLRVWQTPLVR
jgi:DNA-binding MarR family transcriptional regulator